MSTKKRSSRIIREGSGFSDESGLNSSGSLLETSRAQEKEQLTGLNSRLATYIDKVRQLEHENKMLTVQIRDVEVVEKKERANIVDRFENERNRLRQLLEGLEKSEAKAAIERDAAVAEHNRLLARVAKLEKDLQNAEDSKLSAWAMADEANAKYKTMQSRLVKIETESKDFRDEANRLGKQLANIQKALEDETLQRTVAQNELARATEDLAFQKGQHASALEEVRRKRQVDMTTYQKQVTQEYQSKLLEQLAEARAQFQEQLNASNVNIEDQYISKLSEAQRSRDSAREEAFSLRSRMKEFERSQADIDALRRELSSLKQQMQDRLSEKDGHISDLNKEIADLLSQYVALRDIKLQLDTELNTYRILIEGEEERLNLTGETNANNSVTHHASFTASSGSAQRGRKRARFDFDTEGDFDYHHSKEKLQKETSGPVGIDEVDENGQWVRITNTSDEEHNIAKWTLVVRAGGTEVSYKFNNRMKLAPGASCAVYSSNSGHKGHLPASVVMKNENWPIGTNPSARLIDVEGDTVSTITLEESESNDPSQPGDRCTIM